MKAEDRFAKRYLGTIIFGLLAPAATLIALWCGAEFGLVLLLAGVLPLWLLLFLVLLAELRASRSRYPSPVDGDSSTTPDQLLLAVIKQPASEAECIARNQSLELEMGLQWMPGRRKRIAEESFSLGQACRDFGNAGLAETNFQRVLLLFQDHHPTKSKDGLETSALVAAAHNHIGLLCLDTGRPLDGRPSFDRAIELRRELHRLFPDNRENQIYLGGALCNRAHSVADSDRAAAIDFYKQSLSVLRQPTKPCECSYWDERRQSWWCEQLEAYGDALGLQWVFLAPQFIDNAMQALSSLEPPATQKLPP